MARRLSALVIAMVCAATAAALDGSNAINNAAAFGWRGYADTDLQANRFTRRREGTSRRVAATHQLMPLTSAVGAPSAQS